MKKNVLIVDDNDRYANNLKVWFEKKGFEVVRAVNAAQGWEIYSKDRSFFHTIVTDITMETQTSGLWMIRKIHKDGYGGNKIIATTGFDFPGVMFFSSLILPYFAGVGWMVPKVPLKEGKVVFLSTSLKSNVSFESVL
ncbi:response regulator [Leptospira santarosai]|uniref:Response regulator n=6 Tax=Leptospira santarosai TaxID=28183 RepID=A0AB73LUG8_9LEPT|nr:response regulator [Leptospira santarosai]EMO57152.1 response regulator receiver domain protein [Leptospira santarosai str. CBC1416]ASV11911.1 response regulator [Leptospira santarosai]AVV50367.1 Response regulator receiver domain protein [Leptospira santarosai]AVV77962.1 Response regulator receiver domain protein [Leptospira santarosai]EKO34568.1 response regulator receiver domain protein [Leptospira santarosai str. MOR084]